MTNRKGSWE